MTTKSVNAAAVAAMLIAVSQYGAHAGIGITCTQSDWVIGSIAPGGTTQTATNWMYIDNTASFYETVKIRVSNAGGMTAGAAPGDNTFALHYYDGSWINFTTSLVTVNEYFPETGLSTGLKFDAPTSGAVGAKNLAVELQCSAVSGWSYCAAGDFYYKNDGIGETSNAGTYGQYPTGTQFEQLHDLGFITVQCGSCGSEEKFWCHARNQGPGVWYTLNLNSAGNIHSTWAGIDGNHPAHTVLYRLYVLQ